MPVYYPEDYSIIMGLVDLIPVILFALAGCILIKELFNRLKKPFAVMLCSGVTLSLTAGVFKALWKILLAANVCDFYPFNYMFMPTQALGLVLMGAGLISLFFEKKEEQGLKASAISLPVLFLVLAEAATPEDGNIIFIAMLVIGELMIAASLSYVAIKNKQWIPFVLFIVYAIALIIMGAMKPLSTKLSLTVTQSNWIEESINIVAQGSILVGSYLLMKKNCFNSKENS